MTIEQAIESAIKGGFSTKALLAELGIRDTYEVSVGKKHMIVTTHQGNRKQLCSFEKIFLTPNFWKALGKSEGWNCNCGKDICMIPTPKDRCHMMIEALWEGKSVKEYIESL